MSPIKRIDDHMHVSLKQSGHTINGQLLAAADEMLPMMEKYNIEHAVLMSSGEKDCLMDNAELRAICQKYPRSFSYMASFDLNDLQGLEERIQKEKEQGAVGIGEFTEGRPFDDDHIFYFLEIVQKMKLPFLFHLSPDLNVCYGVYDDPGLPLLEKVLQAFPELVVIAHSQPFWCEMTPFLAVSIHDRNQYPSGKIKVEGRVQELLRKYPNLYGDLSANSGGNAIMRDETYGIQFLEEFSERLLYGTDLYCTEQNFPLGSYIDMLCDTGKLTSVTYQKIMRGNAERIFQFSK